MLSCWRDSDLEGVPYGDMMLQIGHNHFQHNEAVATKLSPLVRASGKIEHNDYHFNEDGCVFINNEDDFILEIQHVDLLIFENRFQKNTGPYVLNLGLSHYDYRYIIIFVICIFVFMGLTISSIFLELSISKKLHTKWDTPAYKWNYLKRDHP